MSEQTSRECNPRPALFQLCDLELWPFGPNVIPAPGVSRAFITRTKFADHSFTAFWVIVQKYIPAHRDPCYLTQVGMSKHADVADYSEVWVATDVVCLKPCVQESVKVSNVNTGANYNDRRMHFLNLEWRKAIQNVPKFSTVSTICLKNDVILGGNFNYFKISTVELSVTITTEIRVSTALTSRAVAGQRTVTRTSDVIVDAAARVCRDVMTLVGAGDDVTVVGTAVLHGRLAPCQLQWRHAAGITGQRDVTETSDEMIASQSHIRVTGRTWIRTSTPYEHFTWRTWIYTSTSNEHFTWRTWMCTSTPYEHFRKNVQCSVISRFVLEIRSD